MVSVLQFFCEVSDESTASNTPFFFLVWSRRENDASM